MRLNLCRFLRMCPGLSRQIIGDLLGENNERCLRVLECYTASFDFRGRQSPNLWLHLLSKSCKPRSSELVKCELLCKSIFAAQSWVGLSC